jgi:hypothetical protein
LNSTTSILCLKKNYYTFPNSNQKYRLSLSNSFDNRLILHPPIVDIKSGNESLIGHDFWYEELCNKGDIQITLPQGISVLKFLTVDRKIENFSRVTHQLKRRGDVYRTEYLLQPPETTMIMLPSYYLLPISTIREHTAL